MPEEGAVPADQGRARERGSFLVWLLVTLAVAFMSWQTAIIQKSPLHSDAWAPTLVVWAAPPLTSVVLLVRRRRRWAGACLAGGISGVLLFAASVLLVLLAYGT